MKNRVQLAVFCVANVERVWRFAVSKNGEDRRLPVRGALQRFQYQGRRAFSQIEPFTLLIEWPARIRVERLKRIETAQSEWANRIAATRHHDPDFTIEQHIGRQANGDSS